MYIDPFNFKNLISPISTEDFFENYWEKKPLVLTNRKVKGYKNLFSLEDVDGMLQNLASAKDPVSRVQFINNKKILPTEEYINPDTGILSRSKMLAGYRNGNTIYLHRIEHRCKPANKLCREMEKVLGHLVNAELFLTPQNAQGFNIHYDAVDAFVLQIEGHKLWKIYDRLAEFPTGTGETPYMGDVRKPLYEVTLAPGDMLYIPRGFLHQASTANDYSLHVTLAIRVFSWADLMHEVLLAKPALRKALPVGLLNKNSMQVLHSDYQKMIKDLFCQKDGIDAAFKVVKSRFMKKKKHLNTEKLTDGFLAKEIDKKTVYQKRKGVEFALIKEPTRLRLCFQDDEMIAPNYVEPLLEHILNAAHFSLQSLPNILRSSGKKVLLENLLNSGAIVPLKQTTKRKNHGEKEKSYSQNS